MLLSCRQEIDQAPGEGFDVAIHPEGIEYPQFPAVPRLPPRIEVQDERYSSLSAALRLIDMTGIARTRRIAGVMQLQIEEAQKSFEVQLQTELLEIVEQRPLRRQEAFHEPTRGIAADVLAPLCPSLTTDARRGEFAPAQADSCAVEKFEHARLAGEAVAYGDSVSP